MLERRKIPRFNSRFYLKYTSPDFSGEVSAIAEDVSMGGLKIRVDKSVPTSLGSIVCLFFLMPQETFKVSGEVRWVRNYEDRKELGLRFMQIPDSYKEAIFSYISKYYPQELSRHWWQD